MEDKVLLLCVNNADVGDSLKQGHFYWGVEIISPETGGRSGLVFIGDAYYKASRFFVVPQHELIPPHMIKQLRTQKE